MGKKMAGKKTNRFLKVVLMAFFVIIVVLVGVAATIGIKMFGHINIQEEETVSHNIDDYIEITEDPEDADKVVFLNELRNANDLSTILREWSENTEKDTLMKSKNVTNILLIGCDGSGQLADVIMIASINRETKQIFLTSVMRDSYTYIPVSGGDVYGKINSVYTYGGAKLLKSVIERNFKIDIDYYVSVNYGMFVNIVNLLGGVQVDVQEYEARAITSIISSELGYYRECPYGEGVTLDGELALHFCRIRHCDVDADISRTRRQRQFITAMISKAKDVNVDQIEEIFDQFSQYVRTDCEKSRIITLATQALLNRWYDYEIVSTAFPQDGERLDYSGYAWVWIVDYPLSALNLHNLIYGESNIILAEDRISAVDIMQYSGNTGTASP